jgi:hypothetical protein
MSGPSIGPPSIEQLQELPLPAPISYMPQTWGWWILVAVLMMVVGVWLLRKLYRWRRDRYRREALARLAQLEQQPDNAALREVPELLKRVALSMPRQPDVASLTGQAWQDFLQRSAPVELPADFAARLATLAYAPDTALQAIGPQQRQQLLSLSRQWVETHHVAA